MHRVAPAVLAHDLIQRPVGLVLHRKPDLLFELLDQRLLLFWETRDEDWFRVEQARVVQTLAQTFVQTLVTRTFFLFFFRVAFASL